MALRNSLYYLELMVSWTHSKKEFLDTFIIVGNCLILIGIIVQYFFFALV